MPDIIGKINWNKSGVSKLSSIAIENLTGKSTAEIKYNKGKTSKTENILNNEDDKMVTSTIVETNSSNKTVEAAEEMANDNKYSAIKEASKKPETDNNNKKRGRDYNSGMDLLEMDFILGVVEETSGENDYDVKMRQMCFKELLRRESRHEIASAALKVYATNGKTYGKDLQCEAMEELTFRTIQNSK